MLVLCIKHSFGLVFATLRGVTKKGDLLYEAKFPFHSV